MNNEKEILVKIVLNLIIYRFMVLVINIKLIFISSKERVSI